MARLAWLGFSGVISFSVAATQLALAFGDARPSSNKAADLVRQLGSSSFMDRERASRELTEMGIPAREALARAAIDPDAEIRLRARTILAKVVEVDLLRRIEAFLSDYQGTENHALPGWEQFKAHVGDSHQSRQLFVAMQRAEPELLESYSQGATEASEALNARCQSLLEQVMRTAGGEASVSLGTIAGLLFVGADPNVNLEEQASQLYGWMLNHQAFQKNMVRSGSGPRQLKKLFGAWIVKDNFPTASAQNLIYATYFDLKDDGLALAAKVLASDGGHPNTRQFAVLTIGKHGGKEQIAIVEKQLADATVCGSLQAGTPPRQVELQIRDVALSVLVRLTEQNARDYGLVVQRPQQRTFQVPAIIFVDGVQREAALKRWHDWRAEHPNL